MRNLFNFFKMLNLVIFFPTSDQWLATSGDIFGCHRCGGALGIQCVEARDADKCSALYRTVPHDKELFGPKWQ